MLEQDLINYAKIGISEVLREMEVRYTALLHKLIWLMEAEGLSMDSELSLEENVMRMPDSVFKSRVTDDIQAYYAEMSDIPKF